MSGLNLEALKGDTEDIRNRQNNAQGGDVLYASKIKSGTEELIRVMPPIPELNGRYYREAIIYWIDNVPYVSPETFGKDCPMQEEIDEAKENGTDDEKELAGKISRKREYAMPILHFKDVDGDELHDDNPKIFSCGPMMIEAMNTVALHRNYQPDITSRTEGFNLGIEKAGKGLDTVYKCNPDRDPSELAPELYEEIPNVIDYFKNRMKDPEYLRAKVREWIYGEDIDEELKKKNEKSKKKKDESEDDKEESRTQKKPIAKKVVKRAPRVEEPEEEETEEVEEVEEAEVVDEKPKKSTKARSMLDSLDDIE